MSELRDKKGLTEEEFLRQYNPDKYAKPAVTADIVVFRGKEAPEVLLVRRGGHPYLGFWALPGGFAERNEVLEQTAARELQEETGIAGASMTLVGVYSRPGRDPRGWTVSAAYTALLPEDAHAAAGDDASEVGWFRLERDEGGTFAFCETARDRIGSRLAFDHDEILKDAIHRML